VCSRGVTSHDAGGEVGHVTSNPRQS
jgi:hypothetical protein